MVRTKAISLLILFIAVVPSSVLSRARFPGIDADDSSCSGRCNTSVDRSKPCQCNTSCSRFGDCCSDYESLCVEVEEPLSCLNRCAIRYDKSLPCQCNDQCTEFGNCCADYNDVCEVIENPGSVSNAELAAISEDMLLLEEENNVASLVKINLQGQMPKDGSDNANEPLLEVDSSAYERTTLKKMIALYNNYEAPVGVREVETAEETTEINEFLDAILLTPIMEKISTFLAEKGFVPKSSFRQAFQKIWFGAYSRQNGVLGSSGFEHVFLGELKNGVSGFHNWVFFAQEELNKNLNYKGYIKQFSLGSKGLVISEGFEWMNAAKPISSMFIGTSPEFELAVYTLCFYSRPNAICPLVFNGNKLGIQTFDLTSNGGKFVGSAYADPQ